MGTHFLGWLRWATALGDWEDTLPDSAYSIRRAVMGSTSLARRAGLQIDSRAIAASAIGVTVKATGSRGFTPKRKLARKRVSQNAPPMPMATPTMVRIIPWRMTILRRFDAWAPSAIRTPSS